MPSNCYLASKKTHAKFYLVLPLGSVFLFDLALKSQLPSPAQAFICSPRATTSLVISVLTGLLYGVYVIVRSFYVTYKMRESAPLEHAIETLRCCL
ncbi:hypothetical protein J3F84DRAFT_337018 [Trichoderma pleuroticola]